MAKKKTVDDEMAVEIAELTSAFENGYELGLAWSPTQDRLVTVLVIRVNGHKIVANQTDENSPFVVTKLPEPDSAGKFTVAWAISPEVPVEGMKLGIRNRATKNVVLVGKSKALKKGQLWQNAGATVDAP